LLPAVFSSGSGFEISAHSRQASHICPLLAVAVAENPQSFWATEPEHRSRLAFQFCACATRFTFQGAGHRYSPRTLWTVLRFKIIERLEQRDDPALARMVHTTFTWGQDRTGQGSRFDHPEHASFRSSNNEPFQLSFRSFARQRCCMVTTVMLLVFVAQQSENFAVASRRGFQCAHTMGLRSLRLF
jgi:hypothetical protein